MVTPVKLSFKLTIILENVTKIDAAYQDITFVYFVGSDNPTRLGKEESENLEGFLRRLQDERDTAKEKDFPYLPELLRRLQEEGAWR